jgi:hypothetical protein
VSEFERAQEILRSLGDEPSRAAVLGARAELDALIEELDTESPSAAAAIAEGFALLQSKAGLEPQ